jgi:hypothetical protein
VRGALDRLDALAEKDPEAFRLNEAGWREVIAREDERMAVSKVVAVRLPDALLSRVDAHAQRLIALTGLAPSRSEVVKLLVERGLASVELAAAELDSAKRKKK